VALVFLFYGFLRGRGLSPWIATLAAGAFALNKYLFGLAVWDFFQLDDLLSLMAIVLLFHWMPAPRWPALTLVLVLGTLSKETTLLVIPALLVRLWESRRPAAEVRRTALAMAPAVAVFCLVRWLVPAAGGSNPVEALLANAGKLVSPAAWLRLLINAFVPLSLLPLVFWRRTRAFFSSRLYALVFLLCVVASSFFGDNVERLMAPAAVVIYWLVGEILEGHKSYRLLLICVGLACALGAVHHQITRFAGLSPRLTIALSATALALATAAAAVTRVREWRARSEAQQMAGRAG
jgi:hypothetical protein